MLKSKRILRKKGLVGSYIGQKLEHHASWRGAISLTEVAKKLEGHSPFTYALTQGVDKNHYYLSYVDVDRSVKCRNVRSFIKCGQIFYENGSLCPKAAILDDATAVYGYKTIDELVPGCLKCSANICKPL